ncbi:FUSC family protein [Salinifilum aidingensis]
MHVVLAEARRFVSLGPAENDHLHARRVAVGLFFPGIALLVAGRPDLIIYAAFGSFTGMYGRDESHALRLRQQAQAAPLLLTCAATGVLLSTIHARPWILLAVESACAAAGSLVTGRLGLKPAGPFLGIFALGAAAAVPAVRVTAWLALVICAGTAVFSILVSLTGALGCRSCSTVIASSTGPSRMLWSRAALVHAARYSLAIGAAGTCGLFLGNDHAHWAMISAAVPLAALDGRDRTQREVRGVVHRGMHRVFGTLAGLAVTALLLWPGFSSSVLAALVIGLLFPTELFMARHYGIALGFFTPLIMLMTQLADPVDPVTLLADRIVDTLIGVAAGIGVAASTRRLPAGNRDTG